MDANKKPFASIFLRVILLFYGITLHPVLRKYENVYIFFYVFVIFLPNSMGEYWALVTWTSFIYRLDVLIYAIMATCLVTTLCVNHGRRRHFIYLYDRISNANGDKYFDERFFKISDQLLTDRSIIVSCVLAITGLTMAAVYPFILAVFTDAELGSAPTLLYPSAYPWQLNTPLMYMFTMLVQLTISTLPLCVFGSSILFTFYMRTLIMSFYLVLKMKIKMLGELNGRCIWTRAQTNHELDAGKQSEQERRFLRELHDIFSYYRFLREFINDSISLLFPTAYLSVIQFLTVTMCLVSSLLLVDGNTLYRLKMLNAQIVIIIYFSVNCYLGEWLSHVNDFLINHMYETEWYNRPGEFRRHTALFMAMLETPFNMKLFGSTVINLGLLASAVRTTYSVVQVIYKSQNK